MMLPRTPGAVSPGMVARSNPVPRIAKKIVTIAIASAVAAACSITTKQGPPNGGGPDGSAGDDGGTGGEAGGGTAGDAGMLTPYQYGAETQRILAQAALARMGMPADFDGDGRAEYVPMFDGKGGVTVTEDPKGTGMVAYTFVFDAAALTASYTFDPKGDGTGKWTIATDINMHQTVTTEDTDYDGNPDWRTTRTVDVQARTAHVVVETAPNNDGNFAVVRDTTIPSDTKGGGGNGGCSADGVGPSFPSNAPTVSAGNNLHIRTSNGDPTGLGGGVGDGSMDGPDGSCSNAHVKDLQQGIDCALSSGFKCLEGTNAYAAFQLETALAYGSWDVGCGNTCGPGVTDGANTCGPGSGGCSPIQSAFEPSILDGDSPTNTCDLVLHEMLHWAGVPSDDTHDQGNDQVYACGRYCGGCDEGSPWAVPQGMGITQNTDCAKCASTPEEKAQCGTQLKNGSMTNNAVCHQGLACISANCADPHQMNVVDCNGQTLPQFAAGIWCCNSCPAGCNQSNDLPCGANPTTTGCNGGTPFCN